MQSPAMQTPAACRSLKRLFACCLLLTGFALPLSAWAVDSDGDGVDDSVDAFPNNAEAKTDTDGDGKPDGINWALAPVVFSDTFDAGATSANGWTCTGCTTSTSAHSAPNAVLIQGSTSIKSLRRTITTTGTFVIEFWYKNPRLNVSASKPQLRNDGYSILQFGVVQSWTKYSTLPQQTSGAGSMVLEWYVPFCSPAAGCAIDFYLDDVTVRQTLLVLDTDNDNDGVVDSSDACPLDASASVGNNDKDTLCDVNDLDDDNDGVPDYLDPEPLNSANSSVWPLNNNYQGSAMRESQAVQ